MTARPKHVLLGSPVDRRVCLRRDQQTEAADDVCPECARLERNRIKPVVARRQVTARAGRVVAHDIDRRCALEWLQRRSVHRRCLKKK